ncbi:MAG: malto-oligosyltrehalose trehalohydrolase, partial [Proteobacteria bacterium]
LWSPESKSVELQLKKSGASKSEPAFISMDRDELGYFKVLVPDAAAGDRYKFRLNKKESYPDPASRFQPNGPHEDSEVVDSKFEWTDQAWRGQDLKEIVIYELHVGTFSEAGTFKGIAEKIPHLKEMGLNAIEIMPIAQFAGKRNWGYDGVGLFAAHNTYGGTENPVTALKSLINECHANGISVFLDVVYNHIGPEGNYLPKFGPYFQSKYKTPWGDALNFDGDWSDEVRHFFLQNARQWLEEFHFDGLRLDAVHAIFDTSARPFLEDLTRLKKEIEAQRKIPLHLIAESEANDSRILMPYEEGGLALDGQWADDLHHVVHTLTTGEHDGYYSDYGKLEQLATVFQDGVVFHGEFSEARHRSHGRRYDKIERTRLVVCSQNHDQIGNRMKGERLLTLTNFEKQKLAAACALLSPGLPLLFMGEEFAETAPFLYFIDHTDKDLL